MRTAEEYCRLRECVLFALERLPGAGKIEIMVKSFRLGSSWDFVGRLPDLACLREVAANRRLWTGNVIALVLGAIALGTGSAFAGSCGTAITQIEAALDDLASSPNAGAGHQSLRAQLHRQPTSSSIARGQQEAVADELRDRAVLERARVADARNDEAGCLKALLETQHLRYLSRDRN